ncbi:hypothetical protein A3A37_00430 [Candidatus Kaiserbacteria bacterium RIFCSPLOWO2_01_FULL_52_36]|nr:MAG: hypothetical protein A3A37_00430 [Candidatus Kaiserbacteria bacterium RIFCSPLOWO2_01_FULL_52_36]
MDSIRQWLSADSVAIERMYINLLSIVTEWQYGGCVPFAKHSIDLSGVAMAKLKVVSVRWWRGENAPKAEDVASLMLAKTDMEWRPASREMFPHQEALDLSVADFAKVLHAVQLIQSELWTQYHVHAYVNIDDEPIDVYAAALELRAAELEEAARSASVALKATRKWVPDYRFARIRYRLAGVLNRDRFAHCLSKVLYPER